MRERTTHARERGDSAVHDTSTAEPETTAAAFQIKWPPDILSVQAVHAVGLPKEVRSRDGLVDGNDRHLGHGRRKSRGQAWLQPNRSPGM